MTAIAIPPAIEKFAEGRTIQIPTIRYRGYAIFWFGWIQMVNQSIMVSRWTAYRINRDGWSVYSCYPGNTKKFLSDELLDLEIRKDQEVPDLHSSPEELNSYRQHAFDRLIAYINEHYKELTA
jgi:hypothetical protein